MRGWPKLGQRWGSELGAKSKSKRRAASFFILRGVWRLSITYCLWWYLNVHVRRPNASSRPMHVQPNSFSQSSCIPVLAEGGFLTLLQRFVADIVTRHYRTSQLTPQAQKKLTPQADQEPGQYRIGYDWYSKLIRLEHEHRFQKFWTESCALHYRDLLASKKQETWIDCSPNRNSAMEAWCHATDDRIKHSSNRRSRES